MITLLLILHVRVKLLPAKKKKPTSMSVNKQPNLSSAKRKTNFLLCTLEVNLKS